MENRFILVMLPESNAAKSLSNVARMRRFSFFQDGRQVSHTKEIQIGYGQTCMELLKHKARAQKVTLIETEKLVSKGGFTKIKKFKKMSLKVTVPMPKTDRNHDGTIQ
jgi:hypothetical protein